MSDQNLNMEELFAQARSESPQQSFEETKKRFLASVVMAAGGVLATKGIIHLFSKKWIIMTTLFTLATTSAIIATTMAISDSNENYSSTENTVFQIDTTSHINNKIKEVDPQFKDEKNTETAQFQDVNNYNEVVEIDDFYFAYQEDEQLAWPDDTTKKSNVKSLEKNKVRIKAYSERFEITENTTEAELKEIKDKAEKAGIDFKYKAKYLENKLKELNVSMSLSHKSEGNNVVINSNYTEDEFNTDSKLVLGWSEGDDGKAYDMGMGDRVAQAPEFDMDFDFHAPEFDMTFAPIPPIPPAGSDSAAWQAFEIEMEEWGRSFEAQWENFEFNFDSEAFEKSLEKSLEGLENLNEEIMEKVEAQMEQLEVELERMMEQLEVEMEKMEEEMEKEQEEIERDREREENEEEKEKEEKVKSKEKKKTKRI